MIETQWNNSIFIKNDEVIAEMLPYSEILPNKTTYDNESWISKNAWKHLGEIQKLLVKIKHKSADRNSRLLNLLMLKHTKRLKAMRSKNRTV